VPCRHWGAIYFHPRNATTKIFISIPFHFYALASFFLLNLIHLGAIKSEQDSIDGNEMFISFRGPCERKQHNLTAFHSIHRHIDWVGRLAFIIFNQTHFYISISCPIAAAAADAPAQCDRSMMKSVIIYEIT